MRWGLLSKYKGELYGFSILWIMIFHGLNFKNTGLPKIFKFISGFLKHGNCGVEVFLFLSGVYLYYSMRKDDNVLSFYKKRVLRVYLPVLVIDGFYWLYTCIIKAGNIELFMKNITFYS